MTKPTTRPAPAKARNPRRMYAATIDLEHPASSLWLTTDKRRVPRRTSVLVIDLSKESVEAMVKKLSRMLAGKSKGAGFEDVPWHVIASVFYLARARAILASLGIKARK